MKTLVILITALALAFTQASDGDSSPQNPDRSGTQDMELGNSSISLAVHDLTASREFYQKLGFEIIGGNAAQNWQILRNGNAIIGLFQGMFEKNIMTFNPGWSPMAEALEEFTDVRDLQRLLKERGVEIKVPADETSTGPASIVLEDPDGNPILIDQHVDKPE